MNLGGGRYRKIHITSEQSRRWTKMRRESTRVPTSLPGAGVKVAAEYLVPDESQNVRWKKAGIFALVFHFAAFLLVIPASSLEVVPLERTSATVVKRYTPPAPPAKAKKTRRKKKASVVPIPDPTPDDPEPIEPEESDDDYGDFDDEFVIGDPTGAPGVSSGARDGAFRAGEGGIMSPEIIRQVDPEYTPDATRKGIQGEVWIEAVVDVDGRVIEPRLLRGLPDEELNRRAMEAIQRWVFKPGMKDGQPVPIIAIFTVTYRLH